MSDTTVPIARVVAIGASNLTRGFQTVVSTARAAWGLDVDVVAALGHGRRTAPLRLARVSDDIVITGLPVERIRRLSPSGFLALRSVLTPSSRLSYADVVATAEHVHAGLERLAHDRALRFVPLRPSWYGLDPIHIRPSLWHSAWQEILGVSVESRRSRTEAMWLYLMPPESQSLCGIEQRRPQTGTALSRGARVWLY